MERYLLLASLAQVLLVFIVGAYMLRCRVREMREKHIHPQETATSLQMASQLQNVQAADNFRNLFEVPVLFYALIATSTSLQHTPLWLVFGAWVFVGSRYLHSYIHCTYNRVMHRFPVFGLGLLLILALWVGFVVTFLKRS